MLVMVFLWCLFIGHHGAVTYDWAELARAIRIERASREWSQGDLAERIGVSQGTIKNLEGAHSYKKPPVEHLRAIDAAFGWVEGRLEGILRKEAPPPAGEPGAADAPTPLPPLSDRLPLRVRLELEGGEIADYDQYDLTVGDGARIITFLRIDPAAPGQPRDPEELRRVWREWEQVKRRQRGMKPLPWEPGDPEEWKTDSEA